MRNALLLLCGLCLSGLSHTAPLNRLSGNVRYAERSPLPADTTLTLELLDVTRPDARAERLVRLALPTRGRQIPLAFELPFYAADIHATRRYALRATLISGNGELLFVSRTTTEVLTGGAGSQFDLLLQRAGDIAPVTTLENTYWKLTTVGNQAARVLTGEREAHLLLLDGRASGSSGCNKLMGSYTLAGRALTLGPLASTRMACPELGAQETTLIDAYQRTTAYRIEGETLTLLSGSTPLARFQSRYFK